MASIPGLHKGFKNTSSDVLSVSFSILFGVEQNCIFISNVHRGECVGTEEAQRKYKEEAHSFIVVVLFGSPPPHPSARTGKLYTRETEYRVRKCSEPHRPRYCSWGGGGGGGGLESKRRHKKTVGFIIYFFYGGQNSGERVNKSKRRFVKGRITEIKE